MVRAVLTRFQSVRVASIAAVLISLVIALPAACSVPWSKEQKDPRAYAGSNPEISLDEALEDHRLAVPRDSTELRFKVSDSLSREYWMDLTFHTPCESISPFLTKSGFTKHLQKGYLPDLIETEALGRGWDIGSPKEYAGLFEQAGSLQRSILVRYLDTSKCAVFVFSEQ